MSPSPHPRRAAVLGGNRTPFARANGPYAGSSNQDLLTAALAGLVTRFGLEGHHVGEVVAGAVLKHSRDHDLTRESTLDSGLSARTPAYDVQQACATGLEAAVLVANKIAVGQIECGIAGGTDSATDAPVSSPPVERRTGLSMGEHMARTAAQWGIDRRAQDELAVASHHRLAAAYDRGFFDDLLTPYRGLTRDQHLRADTSVERLAALMTVFGPGESATMTAATSTALSDGASVVLLASDRWAGDRGLPVLAHVVDAQAAAVDPLAGDEGLLMAPVYALPPLLARNGMTLQDFDLVEIHEAFAATVLATLAAWEDAQFCHRRLGLVRPIGRLDLSRLNVNGSSLATGHPFAATGGRILASLAKTLHELGPGARGLISVCAAGGQGVVAILEAG